MSIKLLVTCLTLFCLCTICGYFLFKCEKKYVFHLNNDFISSNNHSISPYIAVIIDDRVTQLLVNAVLNVLQHIPSDWKVQVFTDPKHWRFYENTTLSSFIHRKRVFMTPLPFLRQDLSGSDFINLLLTSVSLWKQIQGEKVFYFQIDSVICSKSPFKLSEFLHYDYIGAPWKVGGCCNGGFSIRSRSKTLQLLEFGRHRFSLDKRINEDVWFSQTLPLYDAKIAPIDVAKRFSVETMFYPRPFAVHKPYIDYIGKQDMAKLCLECPEIRNISDVC